MNAELTFTVGELLTWLLLLVAIVAVVVLIVLLVRIVKLMRPVDESVKKIDKILDDVQIIANNVKEGSEDAKKALNKTSDSLRSLSRILDTNKGPISAISGLANAGASLVGLFGGHTRKTKK